MLRRTRAWLWPLGITIACAPRTEPGASHAPAALSGEPAAGSGSAAPRTTADRSATPAARPVLPLHLELLQRFGVADGTGLPATRWKQCLDWATAATPARRTTALSTTAPSTTVAVGATPPTETAQVSSPAHWDRALVLPVFELPPGTREFVQLDAFVPLQWVPADEPRLELDLARLAPEFTALSAGEHRVARFALDAQGNVLLDSAGQPLHCALRFQLPHGEQNGAGSSEPQLLVFSPFGTLNGADSSSALLQIWWPEPDAQLLLTVNGPGGRSWQQTLTSGKYRLSGLQGGRYTLQARVGSAGAGQANVVREPWARWVINVNPELGEAEQQ